MAILAPPAPAAIRAFRTRYSYTQATLADALGVSKRTIEEWEGGRNPPPAFLALALEALGRIRGW